MATTHHRCPGCGRAVILNDEERKSSHQAPVCAWWDQQMKEIGGKEIGPELLEGGDSGPEN